MTKRAENCRKRLGITRTLSCLTTTKRYMRGFIRQTKLALILSRKQSKILPMLPASKYSTKY